MTDKLIRKYKRIKQKPRLKVKDLVLNRVYNIIDSIVIQIMYYVKDKGNKRSGQMTILRKVNEKFEKFHKKHGNIDIIVAHSLGSVIAFDYVFGFRKYKYSNKAKLKALVTLGSPIPLFTTAMEHVESKLKLPKNVLKWINVLDKDDGVARHCRPFFKNISIEQKLINTGGNPYSAHVGYWKSREVAKIIAKEIDTIIIKEDKL